MRVLLWGEQFWPHLGGAELFAARLIRSLRPLGVEFAVIARSDDTTLCERDSFDDVPIYRFPFWATAASAEPAAILTLQSKVVGVKQAFAPDLVHLNGLAPTSAFFHTTTNRKSPVPSLLTLHGLVSRHSLQPDHLLVRTLSGSDHVSACSEAVLRTAERLAPDISGRSTVVRHGLPSPELDPSPLPENPPVLLCLGRLVPDKGFGHAIDALPIVRDTFPNVRMIMAGDGECRGDLERHASKLGLQEAVTFTGWIAPDQVNEIINRASVVLVPSIREGFGLVALEAAAMGRPVVASRVGGLEEIVVHERTGLLFDPGDAERLAAAVTDLLTDTERAVEMGRAARRRARSEFSWRSNVDAYLKLYQNLTLGGSPP